MTTAAIGTGTSTIEYERGAHAARRAQSTDGEVRTFDVVFGDAVDERPDETPADEVAEDEASAESQEEDDAQNAEDRADEADTDEAFDEDGEDLEEVGVRGTRATRVSAEGVNHALSYAATVDLAELNAQKLTSPSGPNAEVPKAPLRNAGAQAGTSNPNPGGQGNAASPGAKARVSAGAQQKTTANADASLDAPRPEPKGTPGDARAATTVAAHAAKVVGSNPTTPTASVVGAAGAARAPGVATTAGGAKGVSPIFGARGVTDAKLTPGAKATPVRQSPPARQPDAHPAIARVKGGFASILKSGGGRVTLALEPRSLGQVRIDLTLKNGTAQATIQASNESARALLETNLSTLRESLEAKGVRVDRLSVEVRSDQNALQDAGRGHRFGTEADRPHTQGDGTPRDEPRPEAGDHGDAHPRGESRTGGRAPGGRAGIAPFADREDPEGADETPGHDEPGGAGTPRGPVSELGVDLFV